MAFNSWADFFTMGTHGVFVWSAYGLGLVVLTGLVVHTLRDRRKEYTKLKKRYLREQKS